MTKIDSDGWKAKARKRKAYRDHCRDKFFSACGLAKGASEKDVSDAPFKKRLDVIGLMKITRKGAVDAEQARMMTVMAVSLAQTGLGRGLMGSFAGQVFDIERNSPEALRSFFTTSMFYDGGS